MSWRALVGVVLSFAAAACTDDSYVVGATCAAVGTCPAAGTSGSAGASGSGGSASGSSGTAGAAPTVGLALDLSGSGVERLPQPFFGEEPTNFLIADDATTSAWVARVGADFDVVAPAALTLGEASPFSDPGSMLRHAGAITFSQDGEWAATGPGAFALEVVFRGEPGAVLLAQHDANDGLELALDADGRLNLRLNAGASELVVASLALVPDAWHHCLALVDTEQRAAQLFCNGQAGATTNLPAGFALAVKGSPATLGDVSGARLTWAELARWQAASLGPVGAWTNLARERFARLVGTYAEGAREPLPLAQLRASGAYIDMSPSDAPEQRRLHPVGEHWPRIVCRPTLDSPRLCGLLVEASSSQPVAPAAFTLDHWAASDLSVAAAAAAGPTGGNTLFALTPSAKAAEHALELQVPLGDGPAAFSCFARAGAQHLLRADVVGLAHATFDLEAPGVVEQAGTLVNGAEPWGNGLVRVSYSFNVTKSTRRLRIAVLDEGATAVFAGDGVVAASVGDCELRFRSFSTPLPTFGSIQQADRLVYPAGDGNLPPGASLSLGADVWLPAAPLLADSAILNANFAMRYEQQINLFVAPQDGAVQFWGLQPQTKTWQLAHPQAITDGKLHRVVATITADEASLDIDGQSVKVSAGPFDTSVLDRLEIGAAANSSGPLTGIVRQVRVAPGP